MIDVVVSPKTEVDSDAAAAVRHKKSPDSESVSSNLGTVTAVDHEVDRIVVAVVLEVDADVSTGVTFVPVVDNNVTVAVAEVCVELENIAVTVAVVWVVDVNVAAAVAVSVAVAVVWAIDIDIAAVAVSVAIAVVWGTDVDTAAVAVSVAIAVIWAIDVDTAAVAVSVDVAVVWVMDANVAAAVSVSVAASGEVDDKATFEVVAHWSILGVAARGIVKFDAILRGSGLLESVAAEFLVVRLFLPSRGFEKLKIEGIADDFNLLTFPCPGI